MTKDKSYGIADLKERPDRPVFLFGAGIAGLQVRDELSAAGVGNVRGFIDNAPGLAGQTRGGLIVFSPDDSGWKHDDPLVILTPLSSVIIRAMERQCRELGVECIGYAALVAHSRGADVPGWWEDAESIETFSAIVRLLKTRDLHELPRPVPDQYFQPFIPERLYRAFVDGGAYIGDTLAEFRKHVGEDFDAYYAFEPHPDSYGKLLANSVDPRIHTFHVGLSDRKTELFLTTLTSPWASSLVAATREDSRAVQVDTIDAVLAGQPVTYIKLDIEGEELKALNGARQTIRQQKPALAVCVYHRPGHLWEVPERIREIDPGYRLYLRHHLDCEFETVCYAVHRENTHA